MATKVYGTSDDLIEFEGDVSGEVGSYQGDDEKNGTLVIFNDGTLLEIKYGKSSLAIWNITIINKGSKFKSIEYCSDENAKPHSDVVFFEDGMKWAYAAKTWERVS